MSTPNEELPVLSEGADYARLLSAAFDCFGATKSSPSSRRQFWSRGCQELQQRTAAISEHLLIILDVVQQVI